MRTQKLRGSLIGTIGLIAVVSTTTFVVLPSGESDLVDIGEEEVSVAQKIAADYATCGRPPAPEAVAAYEQAQPHIKASSFTDLIFAFELLAKAVRTSPVCPAAVRQLWEAAWALKQEMGFQTPNL